MDAAFAFVLTLLIISFGALPDSVEAMLLALKGVPAFALSFLLIGAFWRGHVDWSDRFGLDDRAAQNLSLLLVFLALVFVYPLRVMFAVLLTFVTGGWLPAQFELSSIGDVRTMFLTFAIPFGSMGVVMVLLYWSAWRRRETLGLDPAELRITRLEIVRWSMIPAFAMLSILLTASDALVRIGVPGFDFFGLNVGQWLLQGQRARVLRQTAADASRMRGNDNDPSSKTVRSEADAIRRDTDP